MNYFCTDTQKGVSLHTKVMSRNSICDLESVVIKHYSYGQQHTAQLPFRNTTQDKQYLLFCSGNISPITCN